MFSLANSKNKDRQKGFTIVELLIVIVVIGILATLVIVTFTGIQKKARDSQRQTDIQAVNSQVAAFYTNYGFYPTEADMATPAFITAYMKGLDPEALKDPKGGGLSTTAPAAGTYTYGYVASGGASCNNTQVTTLTSGVPQDNTCDTFTITANLEAGGTYSKASN